VKTVIRQSEFIDGHSELIHQLMHVSEHLSMNSERAQGEAEYAAAAALLHL
jgi:hypothetical protein